MLRREYVMLAQTWKGQDVKNWFISRKYDGMRAIWDGLGPEVPRPWGRPGSVPTGLWSRYGNPISAPDWWLDQLPRGVILDGELDAGSWAKTVSACKAKTGDWSYVKYKVFDAPRIDNFIVRGKVACGPCGAFIMDCDAGALKQGVRGHFYCDVYPGLLDLWSKERAGGIWSVVEQDTGDMFEHFHRHLDQGAEGIMLRDPNSVWYPKRSKSLLKHKPTDIAVGIVVGHTEGLGKYEGMLGALVIRWEGVEFKLSGMTDAQRTTPTALGKRVLFKHSGFTADGVPREARFLREA